MYKIIGLPLLALAGFLVLGSARPAAAETHFQLYVGAPAYSYSPAPAYADPYYAQPYTYAPYGNYAPAYGGYYAAPRWDDRRWRREREHREHEWREHERREHERREHRYRDRW